MRVNSKLPSFQFIFVTLFCLGNCLELSLQLANAHATQLAGGQNEGRAKSFAANLEDDSPVEQADGGQFDQDQSRAAQLATLRKCSADFEAYKKLFRKHYANLSEQMYRFLVFNASYLRVSASKLAYSSGKQTYYLELGKFSDLSRFERLQMVGVTREKALEILDADELIRAQAPKLTRRKRNVLTMWQQFAPKVSLPPPPPPQPAIANSKEEPIDWRKSPDRCLAEEVVDQGDCNSCYAIVSMRLFEWLRCRQHERTPVRFSEQYLVDCGRPFGLKGCEKGNTRGIMNFVRWSGLLDDSKRPFTGTEAQCGPLLDHKERWLEFEFNQTMAMRHEAALIPNWVESEQVKRGQWHDELRSHPLIMFSYLTDDFYDYGGGLYEPPGECDKALGHFMLLVGFGYDTRQNRPYWLLYNTFGPDFGELGYVRVPVSSSNAEKKANCLVSAIKVSVEF